MTKEEKDWILEQIKRMLDFQYKWYDNKIK